MLSHTVSRLFERSWSNWSLYKSLIKMTAATCMFDAGVDEQLFMHRTGHRASETIVYGRGSFMIASTHC